MAAVARESRAGAALLGAGSRAALSGSLRLSGSLAVGTVKGINPLAGHSLKVSLAEEALGPLVVWSLTVSRVCFSRESVGAI